MTVGKSLVEDMARAYQRANSSGCVSMDGIEACLQVLKDRLPADDRELVERLRKVAPKWREGQHNEHALFDMANLNLWQLNALINEAADRIIALSAAKLTNEEANLARREMHNALGPSPGSVFGKQP